MDYYHWFALRAVPGVGNVTFRRLLERFGSAAAVLTARPDDLAGMRGVGPALATALARFDGHAAAERECREVERHGVRIVDYRSPDYPQLLLAVPDFPPYLYVRGEVGSWEPAVAVVGSRRASGYGLQVTTRLARELAEQGVVVVSGMARGIDAAAHRSALEAGGRSVGVLGCGIDLVYPVENRSLFAQMAEQGTLVSEFPLGTLPLAENFPRRNRIISGISRGILVVEATESSGSLITARCALDQGRDVFAVPGSIVSPASRGSNLLIREGAKIVLGVEDILEELPYGGAVRSSVRQLPELSPGEAAIMAAIADGPLHMDDITVRSALPSGEVAALLLGLELKGAVMQMPGKFFTHS